MKKLILICHGETEWDERNLFMGWVDADLSLEGIQKAKSTAKLLKSEGCMPQFCYTSYLKRAVKALNQILDEMNFDWLPIEKNWQLNDRHYGTLEGLNKAEVAKIYGKDQVTQWKQSYIAKPPAIEFLDANSPRHDLRYSFLPNELIPLAESVEDVTIRLRHYLYENILKSFERYNEVLVVAHESSLKAIVKLLRNMTDIEFPNLIIPANYPYVFEFNDDMKLKTDYFLGNPEEILQQMEKISD